MPFDSTKILAKIKQDVEKGRAEIRQQTDTEITIWDKTGKRTITHRLTEPDETWFQQRIVHCPDAEPKTWRYNKTTVSIMKAMDFDMIHTLNSIYFVASEQDIDYIKRMCHLRRDQMSHAIGQYFSTTSCIGEFWYKQNSIIINMRAIDQVIDEMAKKYDGFCFNELNERAIAVYTTIIHELRHLVFADRHRDRRKYPSYENREEAVEAWAIEFFETKL